MEDKKTKKQPSLNTEEQQSLKLINHPQKQKQTNPWPSKSNKPKEKQYTNEEH